VKEKSWDTMEEISIGNLFLNRTQMDEQLRERIDI
jgi:exo-beta-1,3-glucanase (GH17 family)